jgi:ParB/RepB/Spo0J family partition protein
MIVRDVLIKDIKVLTNMRSSIKNLEGLMQDIKQNGLKQAIGVMPTKTNEYIIVFGNRRLNACKKLGWKKIPAMIGDKDMLLSELKISNLSENIHRENLEPMEEGAACAELKKEGMTASEIAVRLNIPKSRVLRGLDLINKVPVKHKNSIGFGDYGYKKGGKISATVMGKIISCRRQFGLSEQAFEKIINNAQMQEYSTADMYLLSLFLNDGLTATQAIEAMKNYCYQRVDVVVSRAELQELLEKYKMDSSTMLIQSIVYGLVPPLKKPDFLKIKQVPVKV